MFRNYLVTALRNIVRHKLYSVINIAGLAVGLCCVILIILFVRDELSYDKWIPGSENLWRVEITYHVPGRSDPIVTAQAPIPSTSRTKPRTKANRPDSSNSPMTTRSTQVIPSPAETSRRF